MAHSAIDLYLYLESYDLYKLQKVHCCRTSCRTCTHKRAHTYTTVDTKQISKVNVKQSVKMSPDVLATLPYCPNLTTTGQLYRLQA